MSPPPRPAPPFPVPIARARSMFSVRTAVLPGLRLLVRGFAARSSAPPLQWPVRAGIANIRVFGSQGRGGSHDRGWASGAQGEGEEPEEEEEELLSAEPLLPTASQRVCVLHPDVKGRAGRTPRNTGTGRRKAGPEGGITSPKGRGQERAASPEEEGTLPEGRVGEGGSGAGCPEEAGH